MAVWSYQPQGVLTETVQTFERTALLHGSMITGTPTTRVLRRWGLQYSIVTTTEAASMMAFYLAQHGPWQAFDWQNPNDQVTYRVRFDAALDVSLFQPAYLRTNAVPFLEVAS